MIAYVEGGTEGAIKKCESHHVSTLSNVFKNLILYPLHRN